MDLRCLCLTLSLPSVHNSPRWRVEMSSEPGQFPKTRCGKVLFGVHEHNMRRLFSLIRISSPFLLGNGLCPVVLNIQHRNSMKSHSSKHLGRTTARGPPTSLLPGRSSLGSTILNSQMLSENKKTSWNPPEETCCLRPDGSPHASAVAVPQSWATNTAWMVEWTITLQCFKFFFFLKKKINKRRGKKKVYTHVSQHFQKAFCCI